jgi:two-component system, NarL family, sensor kinase
VAFFICLITFDLMKSLLLTIILCSIWGIPSLFGQNKEVRQKLEELKKEIRQSTYYDSAAVFKKGAQAIQLARENKLWSEESLIYQYYGNFYFFSSNLDKAKESYSRSLEIAKKNNDNKLINSTKIRLAFIESTSDVISAEKTFSFLLDEATIKNYTENQIEIYNGLGNIYADRMIKDTSLNFYLKGLKIAEKYGKNYHQAMLLNNIGLLKFNNKQSAAAAKDFENAVKLIQNKEEDRLLLNLNNNLGLVFKEMKNYQSSIKYYQNTVEYARKLGFPEGISVAYLNLSDCYHKNREYKKSLIYADSSINMLKSLNQYSYLGMAFLVKASVLKDSDRSNMAMKYLDSVLLIKKYFQGPSNMIEYHRVASTVYEKQGDFKLALKHKDQYHTMKDSVAEATNQDILSSLQVIYGKEKMEAELQNERNANSLLSKENELKKSRLNSIIIISILSLIGGIGAIYLRHVFLTRKQQANFTQRLIENSDEERSRISKDLHDDIGQSLSVIKSKVNMFNSGKIHTLEGLEKEVGDVIEQTRSISHSLHPGAVAKLGLERSLDSLLGKVQSSTGLVASLSIKNDVEDLSVESKKQVYRIVQECITNTIKHANATALKVSLKKSDSSFSMTYRDNGNGLQDKKMSHGIGMLTMIERAKSINGKIAIQNTDKGFKLTLDVQPEE